MKSRQLGGDQGEAGWGHLRNATDGKGTFLDSRLEDAIRDANVSRTGAPVSLPVFRDPNHDHDGCEHEQSDN